MTRTNHWRSTPAFLLLVVLSLVAAGCGDDDDDDEAAGGSSTTAAEVDDPATGEPIRIGLANNEGPVISLPQYRYGAEAAVEVINADGGINGAPIELIACANDGSPEGSVNCANQFVDDNAVAYFAGLDLGGDAALPILTEAGIPFVSTEPWGERQKVDPNSWVFGPPQGAFTAGPLKALADVGATHVGAFFRDVPTAHDLETAVIQPVAEELGLDVDVIYLDAANPDWAAGVAAAMANGVDSMWGILQETDCIAVVQAARAAGFDGTFSVGSCSLYISVLGDAALNTITVIDTWIPDLREDAPAEIQEELDVYADAMTAAGHEEDMNSFAAASFATMMELAEILRTVDGAVTAESATAALEAATDVPGFMREDASCRTELWPSEPASCRAALLFLRVVPGDDGPARELSTPEMVDVTNFAF